MSAISRLYKSAKSLLLNPYRQDIAEKSDTNLSHILGRTRQQKATMLREIEGKKESPRRTPASSNKKRSRVDNRVECGISSPSFSKKQKILPVREKAADKLKTSPEADKINSELKENIYVEKICEKVEVYDEKLLCAESQSAKMTPLDTKPMVLIEGQTVNAQHHRFGSEDLGDSSVLESLEKKKAKSDVQENDESDDEAPDEMTNRESGLAAKSRIQNLSKASETYI